MILNKEKGKRMWGGDGGSGGSGGSGFDPSSLAGYATQSWVNGNFVTKPFWNQVFEIHGTQTVTVTDENDDPVGSPVVTDITFLPNEAPGTTTSVDEETGYTTTTVRAITSIEAKVGLWTNSYLSALGQNSSGGGGGGATLFEPLLSINESGLAAPTDAQDGMTVVWDKTTHKWKYGATGGGGITVDSALSLTSENPVQNKVITEDIKEASAQTCQDIVDELIGSGGGGGSLNQPLSAINSADLGTPSQSGVAIMWNGTAWAYQVPGGGTAQYTQKVFLAENGGVLTQTMVNTADTIYVIQYDYTIASDITIPNGCMLEFAGGSLRNEQGGSFTITSTNTYVKNYTIECISNVLVVNGFIPMERNTDNIDKIIYTLECFGDYRSDALAVLTLALQNSLNRIVYVNEDITVTQNTALNLVSNYTTLASENNAKITFTGTITFYASSYLTIKDIHLHFDTISQYDQLFVSGSNHITIENIEMSGTTNSSDGQRYGGGIHVINSLNTNIRNNRIYNVFLNGILLHSDCMYADITNNFVDGTTNIGIEVEGRSGALGTTVAHPCSNVTIINNQLYNCSDGGILINFSNGINVIGNIIKYSKTGIHSISNQDVVISSNIVLVNGSALMIDQEFFGDISLTNSNITVSDNSMVGGIANNLTGQEHVIKALVPIQNASNVKLVNNTFRIHRLVNNRDKINDCVIAILSSKYIKVLNNQISGFTGALPTKYNTGIIIGRSYNVVQTENWFEVTDELQQIPSDIKIDNNTIANVVYGISTIIPNSTEAVPYTDGVENKVNQLQVCGNTIQNCTYDANIGQYSNDWKIEDSVLIGNNNNNYASSGPTSSTPQVMTGAFKGVKYFNETLSKPIWWSGSGWVDATGADMPNP